MEGSDDQDPLEGLQERLQSHNRAFESLLALTPARDYYGSHIVDGQDPSEQWNRKKQTAEQKRAAKKAKLDPANQKSALDIMKEREAEALKRKRGEDDTAAENDGDTSGGKLQKSEEDADAAEARRRAIAEKRREVRTRKKEKKDARKARLEAKKAKLDAKKAKKQNESSDKATETPAAPSLDANEDDAADENDDADSTHDTSDVEQMDISGLVAEEEGLPDNEMEGDESSAPTTPLVQSPPFDIATNHSAASSSSSIVPPSVDDSAKPQPKKSASQPKLDTKPTQIDLPDASSKRKDAPSGILSPKIQLPNIDHSILQERLRQRIDQLRAARKADGIEGKPAKSRQELLEQRRKKEEQRKATKKEQFRKAKEEERQKQEERLRGSGSPLSGDIFGASSPQARENSFSFSRLAFEDGTSTDAALTGLQDVKRRKGPQDPKTALQAAQAKQSRIAGYDAEKRTNIAEKDMWINASKRAHGERVRDDTSLLKKALKRKEKQKSKSSEQWKEREQAVVKGKEMKQKKRETNLAKRKEEKGNKGKKKGGKPAGKKKGRPGFEGRFKASGV